MLKLYRFIIEDMEYDTGTYDYDGKFFTTSEALRFIRENEGVGNAIYISSIEFITEECVDPDSWEVMSGYQRALMYSEYMSLN